MNAPFRVAALALLGALAALPLCAQQAATAPAAASEPAATNPAAIPPVAVVTNGPVAGVTTNAAGATNGLTRPILAPSGLEVRGMFMGAGQGRFGVSGRVLKLPAQEAAQAPDQPDDWRRALDFGMNLTKGNSETLRYSLALDAVRERDRDLTSVRAQGTYGESEKLRDTENASARARYERQLSRYAYGLGYADWLTDTIAGTDYRITAIASPGWHLVRTERAILNLEAGAGYMDERKSDRRDGFAAGRLAVSVERVLNDHVLAWCAAEYIPKLSDTSVFFVNTETGVASLLARNLRLSVTLSDRYDNAPAADSESNDLLLTTALSLNF